MLIQGGRFCSGMRQKDLDKIFTYKNLLNVTLRFVEHYAFHESSGRTRDGAVSRVLGFVEALRCIFRWLFQSRAFPATMKL
jgi:hypothetical protein